MIQKIGFLGLWICFGPMMNILYALARKDEFLSFSGKKRTAIEFGLEEAYKIKEELEEQLTASKEKRKTYEQSKDEFTQKDNPYTEVVTLDMDTHKMQEINMRLEEAYNEGLAQKPKQLVKKGKN